MFRSLGSCPHLSALSLQPVERERRDTVTRQRHCHSISTACQRYTEDMLFPSALAYSLGLHTLPPNSALSQHAPSQQRRPATARGVTCAFSSSSIFLSWLFGGGETVLLEMKQTEGKILCCPFNLRRRRLPRSSGLATLRGYSAGHTRSP